MKSLKLRELFNAAITEVREERINLQIQEKTLIDALGILDARAAKNTEDAE